MKILSKNLKIFFLLTFSIYACIYFSEENNLIEIIRGSNDKIEKVASTPAKKVDFRASKPKLRSRHNEDIDSTNYLIENIDEKKSKYLFLADGDSGVNVSIQNYVNVSKLISNGNEVQNDLSRLVFKEDDELRLSLICYVLLKTGEWDSINAKLNSTSNIDVEQINRIENAFKAATLWLKQN